jgi:hypothetical protein
LKRFTSSGVELEVKAHFKGNDGRVFLERQQQALVAVAEVVAKRGAQFQVQQTPTNSAAP